MWSLEVVRLVCGPVLFIVCAVVVICVVIGSLWLTLEASGERAGGAGWRGSGAGDQLAVRSHGLNVARQMTQLQLVLG